MPNTLNSVLAQIPGLAGYEAGRLNNQNTDLANMGLLQRIHAVAQQQALEQEKLKQMTLDRAAGRESTVELRNATLALQKEAMEQRKAQAEAERKARADALRERMTGESTLRRDLANQADATRRDIASSQQQTQRDLAAMRNTTRPIPAPVRQALATNEGNVRRAQTALDLLNGKDVTMKGPDGKDIVLKGSKSATGGHRYVGETISQRINPEDADTLAAIGDLASMVIHDRSGAAVTAAEFPRLRPFIPTDTDHPDIARKKLARFVAEYTAINNELKGMFSKDQGFGETEDKVINFGDLK